jgi:hypothetical protein
MSRDGSGIENDMSSCSDEDGGQIPATANATELALTLAELASDPEVLIEEAAIELRRLVSHSLAAPLPGAVRDARLGLLIQLISDGSGEYVDAARYENALRERQADGEDWPDRSTLIRAYGHWLLAVRAAMRFWFDGGHARVPASYAHAQMHRAYRPPEILASIIRLRSELAEMHPDADESPWPTEWEFEEWGRLVRGGARRAGTEARVPGLKQIRKAFGSYDRAVEHARRLAESR